eukprot:3068153-Amphidinium_carterae.1
MTISPYTQTISGHRRSRDAPFQETTSTSTSTSTSSVCPACISREIGTPMDESVHARPCDPPQLPGNIVPLRLLAVRVVPPSWRAFSLLPNGRRVAPRPGTLRLRGGVHKR